MGLRSSAGASARSTPCNREPSPSLRGNQRAIAETPEQTQSRGRRRVDAHRSIKNFAKLNLIPMACWIATNFQNDAPMTENIFPGLFAAAYAYIVWG